METKQMGDKPKPVKIFKMDHVVQHYTMNSHVGRFEGHIEFFRESMHTSSALRIFLDSGQLVGYVPADMVGEVLAFIGFRDSCPCKGIINRDYDRYIEQFYFWGECMITDPDA